MTNATVNPAAGPSAGTEPTPAVRRLLAEAAAHHATRPQATWHFVLVMNARRIHGVDDLRRSWDDAAREAYKWERVADWATEKNVPVHAVNGQRAQQRYSELAAAVYAAHELYETARLAVADDVAAALAIAPQPPKSGMTDPICDNCGLPHRMGSDCGPHTPEPTPEPTPEDALAVTA